MKFPYREYLSTIPGSSDFRLILRPVISIGITGANGDARWDALVDTGADETLLPLPLAKLLGVSLDADLTSEAAGITGERLSIHYGDVEFRIVGDGVSIKWLTTVGFVDFGTNADQVIILGHGGCLDYFTANFNGEKSELELIPNATLPVVNASF
jgi:predicted aspartyl protease